MRKIIRISLILIAFVMLLDSLSFGDQWEQVPMSPPQKVISEQEILHPKREASFLWPEIALYNNALSGVKAIKGIGDRGSFMSPEIAYSMQSPVTPDVQKKDLFHFENGLLPNGKSGYHSEKIHLTRNNLDPPKKFISSLSVAKYKEENALSRASERFKEEDIFKSLAIFLEVQLNF